MPFMIPSSIRKGFCHEFNGQIIRLNQETRIKRKDKRVVKGVRQIFFLCDLKGDSKFRIHAKSPPNLSAEGGRGFPPPEGLREDKIVEIRKFVVHPVANEVV